MLQAMILSRRTSETKYKVKSIEINNKSEITEYEHWCKKWIFNQIKTE